MSTNPEAASAQLAHRVPTFGLIIIGDEIMSGKRADKHLPAVIERLQARGLTLTCAEYVGDSRVRITAALRRAFASGDVVFSCGGIGATPDDHTRQCAAAALELELGLHPQARALIEERMRDVASEQGEVFDPDRADNVHRLNMGVFPVGADIIPNPYNKIPGFSCDAARLTGRGAGVVHFLPGFPVMAWPYGAMEAALTPLMEDIERRFSEVRVFSLPSVDHPVHGRHIELGVKGDTRSVDAAYTVLLEGLRQHAVRMGPEMVRR